ncbi:zinc-ribbon domain containing protein [Candidatus Peregrinibacteria bacterium]|nr:MAG: zinc-ribbon domain containing protein [Candidatus Peregrinibacteria bacterium]
MNACTQCQSPFQVTDSDRKFYDQVSPIFNGVKYVLPEPTLCPDCRQQRRTAHINELNLYPSECDLCHKKTLTQFPPHENLTIYCRECWHSDQWDPCDYGREFDFSRPFFEQWMELKRVVPKQALSHQGVMINSDYTHLVGELKNCYLIAHADFCENCYYGYGFKKNKFCVDGFYNLHSELCYDCVDVHKCYGLVGSQECINCSNSAFLRDCIGCKDCFLCVGLRQKQYCIRNQQLTKEEYAAEMAKINLESHQEYQKYQAELKELEKTHTFKEYQGHNNQNSSGNHLVNCKDCQKSFDCEDVEGGKYCYQLVLGAKNNMDIYQYGTGLTESYEGAIIGDSSYHLLFTIDSHINSADLIHCWYMESCKNCFGCAEMHRKNYCILNKQYSKEDYNKLVPKIIEHMKQTGEWGEFLPVKYSLFGYNKSTAQLYYPLNREEVNKKGWKWDEYEVPVNAEKVIPASRLPDKLSETPDDILNWAIECEVTQKPFKITPQELKFYRQQKLPIPRRHPFQRHHDRLDRRNPRTLFDRTCAECQNPIQTTYAPDRPETVLCETCYLKNIY